MNQILHPEALNISRELFGGTISLATALLIRAGKAELVRRILIKTINFLFIVRIMSLDEASEKYARLDASITDVFEFPQRFRL